MATVKAVVSSEVRARAVGARRCARWHLATGWSAGMTKCCASFLWYRPIACRSNR